MELPCGSSVLAGHVLPATCGQALQFPGGGLGSAGVHCGGVIDSAGLSKLAVQGLNGILMLLRVPFLMLLRVSFLMLAVAFLVSFLMLAVAFLVWALVGPEVTALRLPTLTV